MHMSAKAEYACLALLELAARHGDPAPVRLADIATKHGISDRFLVQIMLQLKGAGLVTSTRGASGGYHLGRTSEQITLSEILAVVDGTVDSDEKGVRKAAGKVESSPMASALHDVWDELHEIELAARKAQQTKLRDTTLARLVEAGQGSHYVI